MKKAWLLIVCATVGFAYSASARLGETVALVEMRYGKPVWEHTASHDGSTRTHQKMGEPSIVMKDYENSGFKIKVEYNNGISVKETYYRSTELDSAEIEALLQANSNGKKWTLEATGRWKREDGAIASLEGSGKHHKLTVMLAPKGF